MGSDIATLLALRFDHDLPKAPMGLAQVQDRLPVIQLSRPVVLHGDPVRVLGLTVMPQV
jgi:hypothetical protein